MCWSTTSRPVPSSAWGSAYDEMSRAQPAVDLVRHLGLRPDGPYHDRKAYDLLVQAESGVVALTGSPDAPAKVGDLNRRHRRRLVWLLLDSRGAAAAAANGRGEPIDISMLECLDRVGDARRSTCGGHRGEHPLRAGLRHNMIVPYGAVPLRRWQRDARRPEGPRVAAVLRAGPGAPRLAGRSVRHERSAAREPCRARGLIEDQLRCIVPGRNHRRARACRHPHRGVNDIPEVAAHPQFAARGAMGAVATPGGWFRAHASAQSRNARRAHGRSPRPRRAHEEVLEELDAGR